MPSDAEEPVVVWFLRVTAVTQDGAGANSGDDAVPVAVSVDPLAATGRDLAIAAPAMSAASVPEMRSPSPSLNQVSDARVDPLIGLVVADRYKITERVGRGGMGVVYQVEHVRIGKLLAMKLLAGELAASEEIMQRFEHEALAVSKLSSPNTVQVFDYGVWNNLTYLVMELVAGYHLGRALRKGPMTFARLGRLLVDVCGSLGEAHDKGIVHRDIKPENIMIVPGANRHESAKVLDFGLAKLRENRDVNSLTLRGSVVGTPYFISPEQVSGDPVDGRSDIYALGTLMFRALTGSHAFDATTPVGMFTHHLTSPAPSACERAPDQNIDPAIDDLIQMCMAKDPADRVQSVAELRDVLVGHLKQLGETDGLWMGESGERRSDIKRRAIVAKAAPGTEQLATRAELEDYERKLKRSRLGGRLLVLLVVVGGLALAARSMLTPRFEGRESEPNDTAPQANTLPLGEAVAGQLGKRIDAETGDRDFFSITLPTKGYLSIEVLPLPNVPLCTLLYRAGYPQPIAEYCGGRANLRVGVDALQVAAGDYYVGVVQDLRSTDGALVHENVSDDYRLTVQMVTPTESDEIEPNDSISGPQLMSPGTLLTGRLRWKGDKDVYCLTEGTDMTPLRWVVTDQARANAVLEVTPLVGNAEGRAVRLHPPASQPIGRPATAADVSSPWRSALLGELKARCVRIRGTQDPWGPPDAPEPVGDVGAYTVELVAE